MKPQERHGRAPAQVVLYCAALLSVPAVFAAVGYTEPVSSGDSSAAEPFPCVAYDPLRRRWGRVGLYQLDSPEENCPPDYAFLSVQPGSGDAPPGAIVPVAGACCRLPEGVLSAAHVYAAEACPADHVATGTKLAERPASADCGGSVGACWEKLAKAVKLIRCTKIDTARYQLGPARPGAAVGWERHFSTALEKRTTRSRIPAALRYAVGRTSFRHWDRLACVGVPFGSVLTGKRSKYCSGMEFSELQYRGKANAAAAGAAVQVLPQCDALSRRFHPEPECLRYRRSRPPSINRRPGG